MADRTANSTPLAVFRPVVRRRRKQDWEWTMGGWMGAALVVAVALSSLEHHQNGCLVGGASAFAIAAVVHSPMSYSSSEKEGMDGRTTRTHPGSSFLAAPTVAAFRRRGGGGTEAASRSSSARLRLSSSSAGSATAAAVSRENLALLSERGRAAVERLVHWDATTSSMNGAPSQTHVYGDWPLPGTDDDGKRQLAEQLADLDESYPGGLASYLTKAQRLLLESADGSFNPYDEYTAVVPQGQVLSMDDNNSDGMTMRQAEAAGWEAAPGLAFVLVAGGLGERLGYSGIKLSLQTEICTDTCYLELYARYIQAVQYRAQQQQLLADSSSTLKLDTLLIPLVIMTSGDTDAATRRLLAENANFGLDASQVEIVTQDKVPALQDVAAGLALSSDRWTIDTKPHGHGDVHQLLARAGLVEKWEAEGRTHVVFLQDTNALVINSVIPTLGVSARLGLHMNSICIPRLAGEAAGAIARLEHKTDPNKSLVINVEYNQLDPLLRTQGDGKGDVADPQTGYSPFPGNANNLVLELSAYSKTLRGEDQGVVLEFVNPKYKDSTRTVFKKPTRLECMMQDIPKLFQKEMGAQAKIGFTMFDRWFTFSPAKNALDAGQDAVKGGSKAPGTMSSAESDLYVQNQRKLKYAGVELPTSNEADYVTMAGIPVTPGPRISVCPTFGISPRDFTEKVHGSVILSQRSSLVLKGRHICIRGLDLDGALVIHAGDESHITVKGLQVKNKGWEFLELGDGTDAPETVRIRGYTMAKKETLEYHITEPGRFTINESGQVTVNE